MTSTSGSAHTEWDAGDLVEVLVRSAFIVMTALNRLGAESDLSSTQIRVIGILQDRDHVRMSDLAQRLGLDKSTVTGLIRRAEARGLVSRVSSEEDRRAIDVTITTKGRELADHLRTELYAALAPATAKLSDARRHALQSMLTEVIRWHDEQFDQSVRSVAT